MFLAKLSRNYRVLYFSPTPPVHGLRHGTRPVLQWDIYCGGWASLDTSLSPEVEQPTSGLALDVACSWTRVSAIPVSRPSLSFSNPWCLRVPVVLRCPHCHTVRVIWSRFFRLAFFFRKKELCERQSYRARALPSAGHSPDGLDQANARNPPGWWQAQVFVPSLLFPTPGALTGSWDENGAART